MKSAETLQTKLSLELRDMIYTNLWTTPEIMETCERVLKANKSSIHSKYPITIYWTLSQRIHFIDKHYVSSTTTLETVNAMYRMLPSLESPLTTDLADLPHICRDPFGVGHCATYALRQLKIICKVDRYRIKNKCESRKRKQCTHTACERAYTYQEYIRRQLEPMLRVAQKRNFHLELLFIQRNIRLGVLSEVLEAFIDVYRAFETAGANVTVIWQYASKTFKTAVPWNRDCKTCKLARDIEPFFEIHRSH